MYNIVGITAEAEPACMPSEIFKMLSMYLLLNCNADKTQNLQLRVGGIIYMTFPDDPRNETYQEERKQ